METFLVPEKMPGVSRVVRVAHHPVANAVGAAIAQVSGELDQVFQNMTRDGAIAEARRLAEERAVRAGADRATLEVVEVEDIPSPTSPATRCARASASSAPSRGPADTDPPTVAGAGGHRNPQGRPRLQLKLRHRARGSDGAFSPRSGRCPSCSPPPDDERCFMLQHFSRVSGCCGRGVLVAGGCDPRLGAVVRVARRARQVRVKIEVEETDVPVV
jgi:hypothetical protein